MTYEQMKCEMTVALKQGDKFRRLVIADAVASIDKAATAGKTRIGQDLAPKGTGVFPVVLTGRKADVRGIPDIAVLGTHHFGEFILQLRVDADFSAG